MHLLMIYHVMLVTSAQNNSGRLLAVNIVLSMSSKVLFFLEQHHFAVDFLVLKSCD